jgi:hypothetical protein
MNHAQRVHKMREAMDRELSAKGGQLAPHYLIEVALGAIGLTVGQARIIVATEIGKGYPNDVQGIEGIEHWVRAVVPSIPDMSVEHFDYLRTGDHVTEWHKRAEFRLLEQLKYKPEGA